MFSAGHFSACTYQLQVSCALSCIDLFCFQLLQFEPDFYHQQRSFGKVMFLHLSVILSTGGYLADKRLGKHPPRQTPPRQTPPRQTPPPGDGHCGGRYASYWNAFLFVLQIKNYHLIGTCKSLN